MSEKAWTWCVAELRDKADEYKQKQYLRILDTGSCVCKSDTLNATAFGVDFKSGIEPLLTQQNLSDQISSIVDPSISVGLWKTPSSGGRRAGRVGRYFWLV